MDTANQVRVPKPSKKSFNPDRPVEKNALLQNQVRHARELELEYHRRLDSGIRFEDVRTEGQAAEYIKRITYLVHPHYEKKKAR